MRMKCAWIALVSALMVTVPLTSAVSGGQTAGSFRTDVVLAEDVQQVIATGRVKQIHTPQLFEISAGVRSELFVLASSVPQDTHAGSTVEVRGVLRPFDEHLIPMMTWNALAERTRAQLTGRPVLVASSLITERGDELVSSAVEVRRHHRQAAVVDKAIPITLRPVMLAHNIEELAGHDVKIVNARVVGVFEPHALLVESATRYEQTLGERDRILVLIDAAKLRVPADAIVASTVNVVGVARTLLGAQATAEVPWPTVLNRDLVRRLEVRAAVLATSVQTAEGTELTDRRSAGPPVPRR